MSGAAAAFAALEEIEAGSWDHYLLRLRAGIEGRMRTEAYRYRRPIVADITPPPHSPDAEVLARADALLSKYFHPSRGGLRKVREDDPVAALAAARRMIRLAAQLAEEEAP